MKESFVFFKSYADAIACIKDDAERLQAYDALIKYAIYGEEEEVDGAAGAFLKMAITSVDGVNKRYERAKACGKYGKLGGRPKKQKEEPAEEAPQDDTTPEPEEVEAVQEEATPPKKAPQKHKYGEHGKVLLTDEEFERLKADYGEDKAQAAIDYFDTYLCDKPYKSKSHNMAMRRWVFQAVEEREAKKHPPNYSSKVRNFVNIETRNEDMQALESQLLDN